MDGGRVIQNIIYAYGQGERGAKKYYGYAIVISKSNINFFLMTNHFMRK